MAVREVVDWDRQDSDRTFSYVATLSTRGSVYCNRVDVLIRIGNLRSFFDKPLG